MRNKKEPTIDEQTAFLVGIFYGLLCGIIIGWLATIPMAAHALSDYNWYDYNFNLAPNGAAPLILPVLPTSNYNIGEGLLRNSTPGPSTIKILGTPSADSHNKVITPSGMHDMYTDGNGNSEIR